MTMLRHAAAAVLPLIAFAAAAAAAEPTVISLWEHGAPGFEDRQDEAEVEEGWSITNIHNPSLTVFLPEPEKANGVGIPFPHREIIMRTPVEVVQADIQNLPLKL